jgi:hypothetical protein
MSTRGVDELIRSRSALLDALDALGRHTQAVIVIGAHAVYLRTGRAAVAVAEFTRDSDLVLDPRILADEPLIEAAMAEAGFRPDPAAGQPGAWLSGDGIPVDLMVPAALAPSGRRAARIPPHSGRAARKVVGLEAAVVDNSVVEVPALGPGDRRRTAACVAGPMALLVAKLHKIGERQGTARAELKDAHDVYRLLVAVETEALAASARSLLADDLAGTVTRHAMSYLRDLFAAGPDAAGARMAGDNEALVGDPATVAASASVLAHDLLVALRP